MNNDPKRDEMNNDDALASVPVSALATTKAIHDRETRALGYLAVAALAAILWLAMPVGIGLFLGVLLAFTLEPVYGRLRGRGWARGPAALVCVLSATIGISVAFAGLATLLITRGVTLVEWLPTVLAPKSKFHDAFDWRFGAMHINPTMITTKLQEQAMAVGARAAGLAAAFAGATFAGMLTLLFMALASFFVLRHWNELVSKAEKMLPFERRHTHALFAQFKIVGRQVLQGTVVTGLFQGVSAGVGYWICGAPDPAFFGALTAVASLVPAIGTMLVWVPVGIYLLATGHPASGIGEMIYALLVVVILTDYVIRPKLVGREKGVPAVLTFVSLFGGAEVFGVVGLVLGPVIMALAIAILKTYETEISKATD